MTGDPNRTASMISVRNTNSNNHEVIEDWCKSSTWCGPTIQHVVRRCGQERDAARAAEAHTGAKADGLALALVAPSG